MTHKLPTAIAASALLLAACAVGDATPDGTSDGSTSPGGTSPQGWLSWRGPMQNGTSLEKGLPGKVEIGGRNWTYELAGRGTPVVAAGRVYTLGYEGEKSELQEILVCLDERTGKRIWEHRFTDFVSDIIYSRYSIGSPTIDPETGNVLCLTAPGLLLCFTADGKLLWEHSMMSEYGRLTFPNGRTGAPLIVGDLAIVHVVTSGWGAQAPARDRFYAFHKRTGKSVWSSTPGGPPKDISFSFPVVATENNRRVLYAGLGGGHLVCVDTRTGDPIWRFQMSIGGLSTSPLLYKDSIIAIHGKENTDTSAIGRMVAIRRGTDAEPAKGPIILDRSSELWRNDLVSFTSSPVLVGNRVYQTVQTGDLYCVDADTGRKLWHHKLAPDQIHASPAYGDGKLYVPMNNGSFYIIEPKEDGPKILQKLQLEGNCLGAPAIANGKVYVHTTGRLYSFGGGVSPPPLGVPSEPGEAAGGPVGKAVRLQVIPADVVFRPGTTETVNVRSLDARGRVVNGSVDNVTFHGLPGRGVTLRDGVMEITKNAPSVVSVVQVESGSLRGAMRLRIVPDVPYTDDFETASLRPHPREPGVKFAPPRPYWVGVKLKWEIRELDGNNVLAKTLDRPLFQRTMSMIGHPDMANYTVQVDILSDGNRRMMSSGGVVNQRYLIVLKGNHQALEISSNMELLKEHVRFRWKPKTWYRLKTRVDVTADGRGVIRAKVWQRDVPEPQGWTIEVPHSHAHKKGSPGIYGFVPQSRFMVYLDNLSVTSND
ncbi:MAG: outer membrane protein assembly factor BamB family protein [Planctomycetota bacterium]|jgi:outer membrane protein assembly factor BamB